MSKQDEDNSWETRAACRKRDCWGDRFSESRRGRVFYHQATYPSFTPYKARSRPTSHSAAGAVASHLVFLFPSSRSAWQWQSSCLDNDKKTIAILCGSALAQAWRLCAPAQNAWHFLRHYNSHGQPLSTDVVCEAHSLRARRRTRDFAKGDLPRPLILGERAWLLLLLSLSLSAPPTGTSSVQ